MPTQTQDTPTLTDIWLRRLKNNRVVAIIIVLGIVIIAASKFWGSLPEPAQRYLRSAPSEIRKIWVLPEQKAAPSVSGPTGDHFLPLKGSIAVQAGSGRVIDFPQRLRRLSVADTEIADLQIIHPYQIELVGHRSGYTTLTVWNTHGEHEEHKIHVTDGATADGASHKEEVITIEASSSRVIDFPKRLRRISIADTSVADLQVVNPFEIDLVGHKPGSTTLVVWTPDYKYTERRVHVTAAPR